MEQTVSLAEQTLQNANNGQTCSEALMTAFADTAGIEPVLARNLSSGFAGGMGGTGKTCGAVTAAFMILGRMFGPDEATDAESRKKTFALVAEFSQRFNEQFGTTECSVITEGYDITSPAETKRLKESGLPAKVIHGAAELLETMLKEQGKI